MMLTKQFRRVPSSIILIVRHQASTAPDPTNESNHDGQTAKTAKENLVHRNTPPTQKTIRDKHLANITVTSFYSQSAIEQHAAKVIDPFSRS